MPNKIIGFGQPPGCQNPETKHCRFSTNHQKNHGHFLLDNGIDHLELSPYEPTVYDDEKKALERLEKLNLPEIPMNAIRKQITAVFSNQGSKSQIPGDIALA